MPHWTRPPVLAPPRRAVVLAVSVVLVLVGCSSGGDDDGSPASEVPDAGSSAGTVPRVVSDLVGEGEQVCADEEGDLTQSASADVSPAVPQPGLDLVEARARLDGERLSVTFETAGPVRSEQQPEFVLFVGLVDDLNGFEVRVAPEPDGVWVASLLPRGVGVNQPVVLPTAAVTAIDTTVEAVIPVDQLPDIGPNQPVVYGSSGLVVDEAGTFLDRRGEPVDSDAEAARAFEECLTFGQ